MHGEGGIEACDPDLTYRVLPERVVEYLKRLGKA